MASRQVTICGYKPHRGSDVGWHKHVMVALGRQSRKALQEMQERLPSGVGMVAVDYCVKAQLVMGEDDDSAGGDVPQEVGQARADGVWVDGDRWTSRREVEQ